MTLKKNIVAFVIIGILGTLGHFLYELTNQNFLIGLFFPVNESTWEHLKLLFFPTLLYSVFEYLSLKEKPNNYLFASALGLLCGMITIVTLFYTISGILGFNVDFINIAIYFLGVITTLKKRTKILDTYKFDSKILFYISLLFLIIFSILFFIFTYNPPKLGLFKEP